MMIDNGCSSAGIGCPTSAHLTAFPTLRSAPFGWAPHGCFAIGVGMQRPFAKFRAIIISSLATIGGG